jgi:predicted RNA-binding Zn-ribbon protein involved in translation (DUF1610 family)
MIEFDCPECGEEMGITDRMAGRRVRCTSCDALIDVPEDSPRRRESRRRKPEDPGLSSKEYWLFFLLFMFVPYACVLVSSILYYVWKGDRPKRANQINSLGFIVFGINIAVSLAIYIALN